MVYRVRGTQTRSRPSRPLRRGFGGDAGLVERSSLCRNGIHEFAVAGELGSGHVRLQPLGGCDSTLGDLGLDRAGFDDDDLDPGMRLTSRRNASLTASSANFEPA